MAGVSFPVFRRNALVGPIAARIYVGQVVTAGAKSGTVRVTDDPYDLDETVTPTIPVLGAGLVVGQDVIVIVASTTAYAVALR